MVTFSASERVSSRVTGRPYGSPSVLSTIRDISACSPRASVDADQARETRTYRVEGSVLAVYMCSFPCGRSKVGFIDQGGDFSAGENVHSVRADEGLGPAERQAYSNRNDIEIIDGDQQLASDGSAQRAMTWLTSASALCQPPCGYQ